MTPGRTARRNDKCTKGAIVMIRARLSFAVLFAALLPLPAGTAAAQEKMSHDEWQRDIEHYTQLRNGESAKVKQLDGEIAGLRIQSTGLDGDCDKCLGELYALVGSDAQRAAAYRNEIAEAEKSANDLLRLSDADLLSRSADVKSLSSTVKGLWKDRLSLIPEFYDRLTALNTEVAKLEKAIGGQKTYTVGTWSRDRDCLWTIAAKKTVYDSPWLWPKIWQGNRDQIKDPDLIYPGEKLAIPPAGALTSAEKSAERSYYDKKGHTLTRKPLAGK